MYTDEAIIDALRCTAGQVFLAAERLRCHWDTIYKRARANPAIQDAIDGARGRLVDKSVVGLTKAVNAERKWAITYTLDRLGKDRGFIVNPQAALALQTDSDKPVLIYFQNDRNRLPEGPKLIGPTDTDRETNEPTDLEARISRNGHFSDEEDTLP